MFGTILVRHASRVLGWKVIIFEPGFQKNKDFVEVSFKRISALECFSNRANIIVQTQWLCWKRKPRGAPSSTLVTSSLTYLRAGASWVRRVLEASQEVKALLVTATAELVTLPVL